MGKSNKRIIFGLVLSCWLIYVFSMCLKMVYSGAMASVREEYGVSNKIASLPTTLHYVFYAAIQFVLSFVIKKINLKRYMAVTLIFSGLSFISVFFYSPMWYICAVLAINGITLGAVWCGSVMVLGKYLSLKTMTKALLFMSVGFSFGSAMSFGVSALAINFGNWRISFIVLGIAFVLAVSYFVFSLTCAEKANITPTEERLAAKSRPYTAERYEVKLLVIMAVIAVFLSCLLYYAFTNWMPTILKNVFNLANENANLITVLFPIVVFAGPTLAVFLCNRVKNDFLVVVIACAFCTVLSLVLRFTYDFNVVFTVITILVLGVFLRLLVELFVSLITVHTREYISAGKLSATVNAVASAAAAASPFLIGSILDLSDNDWKIGFLFLFVIAVLMLLICTTFYIIRQIKGRKIKREADTL